MSLNVAPSLSPFLEALNYNDVLTDYGYIIH